MKVNTVLKKIGLLTCMLFVASVVAFAQNQNVLQTIDQETTNAKDTAMSIAATICWIFLGIGIVAIIYAAVADQSRLKIGIICFLAAGLFLTVGYSTNIF